MSYMYMYYIYIYIGGAQNDFLLCLKESLLIQLHKPILNKSVKSMPLQLFTE